MKGHLISVSSVRRLPSLCESTKSQRSPLDVLKDGLCQDKGLCLEAGKTEGETQ
jgi:hypothetical protein